MASICAAIQYTLLCLLQRSVPKGWPLVPREYIGHYAILPGRTFVDRIAVHCDDIAGCDLCLAAVAEFLANEMEYELVPAMDKTIESYQAELGADRCTLERAQDLRRMTVAKCCPGVDRFYAILADAEVSCA